MQNGSESISYFTDFRKADCFCPYTKRKQLKNWQIENKRLKSEIYYIVSVY